MKPIDLQKIADYLREQLPHLSEWQEAAFWSWFLRAHSENRITCVHDEKQVLAAAVYRRIHHASDVLAIDRHVPGGRYLVVDECASSQPEFLNVMWEIAMLQHQDVKEVIFERIKRRGKFSIHQRECFTRHLKGMCHGHRS